MALEGASAAGHELEFVFFEPGPWPDELRRAGFRVEVIVAGRMRQLPRLLATVVRLARLLRARQPELILNWMTKTQVYGAPAAMLAAAPPLDESQFAGLGDQHPAQYSAELKQQLTDAERAELEKKELAAKVREIRVIPVVVSVNADKPNTAEAGIGYGTDTGVRFRTQYRKALVNSHGHNIDSNLEISQIRQAVDVRYNMPYKHPLDDTISVFGGFEQEKNGNLGDQLGLTTQSVTLGAERAIKPKNGDWQHTMSVRYRLEQRKRETGQK